MSNFQLVIISLIQITTHYISGAVSGHQSHGSQPQQYDISYIDSLKVSL